MNVYKYDEKTKEYIGIEEALLDPLETKLQQKNIYLLPANATFTAPTEAQEGYVNIWKGSCWEQLEDNRGMKYWLPEDKYGTAAREMKELGALPDGAVLTPPEKTLDELKQDALNYQYQVYEKQKHAIAWINDGSGYGFDAGPEDQNNWQVALTLMEDDVTMYRVYTNINDLTQKSFLQVTRNQMMEAGTVAKQQQYAAYAGFEKVKVKIINCPSAEELKPYLPPETA